jgi:hypothetical protein
LRPVSLAAPSSRRSRSRRRPNKTH